MSGTGCSHSFYCWFCFSYLSYLCMDSIQLDLIKYFFNAVCVHSISLYKHDYSISKYGVCSTYDTYKSTTYICILWGCLASRHVFNSSIIKTKYRTCRHTSENWREFHWIDQYIRTYSLMQFKSKLWREKYFAWAIGNEQRTIDVKGSTEWRLHNKSQTMMKM